jgi:phage terminase large subunit-like protein
MQEYPQTTGNLTAIASNLYELVKTTNLIAYVDEPLRKQVHAAIAVETPRGWRISKEKASTKIDAVVALAMAALPCVQERACDAAPQFGNLADAPRPRVDWRDASVF